MTSDEWGHRDSDSSVTQVFSHMSDFLEVFEAVGGLTVRLFWPFSLFSRTPPKIQRTSNARRT